MRLRSSAADATPRSVPHRLADTSRLQETRYSQTDCSAPFYLSRIWNRTIKRVLQTLSTFLQGQGTLDTSLLSQLSHCTKLNTAYLRVYDTLPEPKMSLPRSQMSWEATSGDYVLFECDRTHTRKQYVAQWESTNSPCVADTPISSVRFDDLPNPSYAEQARAKC